MRRRTPFAVHRHDFARASANLEDSSCGSCVVASAPRGRPTDGFGRSRFIPVLARRRLEHLSELVPERVHGGPRASRGGALGLEVRNRAGGVLLRQDPRVGPRRFGRDGDFHPGVPGVTALVAYEGVEVLVVYVPAVPALMRVLPAVIAHAVPVRHRSGAPRALQHLLRFRVKVDVKSDKLHDARGKRQRRRQLHRRLRGAGRELNGRHALPRGSIDAKSGHGHRRGGAVDGQPANLPRSARVVQPDENRLHGGPSVQLGDDGALGVAELGASRVQLLPPEKVRRRRSRHVCGRSRQCRGRSRHRGRTDREVVIRRRRRERGDGLRHRVQKVPVALLVDVVAQAPVHTRVGMRRERYERYVELAHERGDPTRRERFARVLDTAAVGGQYPTREGDGVGGVSTHARKRGER